MIKYPSLVGAVVVVAALTLSACSSSSSGANAAASTSKTAAAATASSTASASPTQSVSGSNSNSTFCNDIKEARVNSTALEQAMLKTFASGKFATEKAGLASFFKVASSHLPKLESDMGSVPANVQAAVQQVNKAYAQIQSIIAAANTQAQLEASMLALGKNVQLQEAVKILAAYQIAQCGTPPTPTP